MIKSLLDALQSQGVQLWFEGEKLRFRAPKNALTVEQRTQLSAQRTDILAQLRAEASDRSKVLPPSYSQQSLWFLNRQAPESSAYNIAMPMRVLSALNVPMLKHALQALVDRHETLRTTYDLSKEGVLSQRIAGVSAITLDEHAVTGMTGDEVRRVVRADYCRPFDLDIGPVFRASLFTHGPDDHVLLLTVHHIAADGWSLVLLMEELLKIYAEATGGPAANLARPDLQYSDYVKWQEQHLKGPNADRLWSYWCNKLAAPRMQVELPIDHLRPENNTFSGSSLPLQLDPELTQTVKDLARQEGTTPFVVLLATFKVFLFQLTGVEDVIVGTPTFARSKPEFMRVLGDFVNTVPLRSRLTSRKTFCGLIGEVRQTVLEALDAQEYPLSLLVERLKPERDSSRSTLFDTFFILQRFDQFRDIEGLLSGDETDSPVDIGGLCLGPYAFSQQEGQFDLALQFVERSGAFRGVFNYRKDLFDGETMASFAADYCVLVRTLTANSNKPFHEILRPVAEAPVDANDVAALIEDVRNRDIKISVEDGRLRINAPKGTLNGKLKEILATRRDEIIAFLVPSDSSRDTPQLFSDSDSSKKREPAETSVLTAEEQHQLEIWNATVVKHDRSRTLHSLMEKTARTTPDATAVLAGLAKLSYRDLDRRSNQLARLLQRRGVRAGHLVAVCLDRTAEVPVALAAVLKAGAAYVPLDPAHPVDRLHYTVEDAGASCVITLSRFSGLFDKLQRTILLLDDLEEEFASDSDIALEDSVKPEDLAYVIYTSGSTGRPKGVEITHANVVNFIEAMRCQPGLSADDVVLAVTTLSFDIAGLEIWLPLSVGAQIVLASSSDVLTGESLAAIIRDHNVTLLQATPSTWRLLLDAGWAGKHDLKALCGGEALTRELAVSLMGRVSELWNMYGPTETTIWSTVTRISDETVPITIGRPIANTRIFVLDQFDKPVPIGVAGELCIGGEGVARGYHNREELTAEKFVTMESLSGARERVYRTGDVARFRSDGELEFLGRRDHQVKLRGHRIELGEIEAALSRISGVKECAVVLREDNPGDQRLIGYVAVTGVVPFNADSTRAALRRHLPEYMIPAAFVELAAFPRTLNGKLDRKSLPALKAVAAPKNDLADAFMTPAQRMVASVWRDVLQVARVGLHENFFDAGGHSLLLVKLQAGLAREFRTDIVLVELFQHTTVAMQADRFSSPLKADEALRRAKARIERQIHG